MTKPEQRHQSGARRFRLHPPSQHHGASGETARGGARGERADTRSGCHRGVHRQHGVRLYPPGGCRDLGRPINIRWLSLVPAFDPTFVILATAASVEAIFLSTFVLISQNRDAAMAERRAQLDLQTNLLSEHEITRLLSLTVAIARRLGIDEASDPRLAELLRDVQPEKVLDRLSDEEEDE